MQALTIKEARKFCKGAGLLVTEDGVITYKSTRHQFFVKAPEEHRRMVVLARTILCGLHENVFSGGLLWLRRWDIGSPQLTQPGWLILESLRRATGEMRSLELAPAQKFREDEFVALHVFLIQSIAYGWVADFIPSTNFFFHFKDNRQICCRANSANTLQQLRTIFEEWEPTDNDPMLVKLALLESSSKKRQIHKSS
jgi:hypothetical protein